MQFLYMALFALGIVAADQFTKYLTVANIAAPLSADAATIAALKDAFFLGGKDLSGLPESLKGIPGIFKLTHVHNEGAAFSMLSGQQWLFGVLFVLLTAAVIYELIKKPLGLNTFERWCVVAVWAGGLGNMLDRLRLGYVVDMVEVEFMNFAVFNVADCFITCGCIALMVSLVFFNKQFWKDSKKK